MRRLSSDFGWGWVVGAATILVLGRLAFADAGPSAQTTGPDPLQPVAEETRSTTDDKATTSEVSETSTTQDSANGSSTSDGSTAIQADDSQSKTGEVPISADRTTTLPQVDLDAALAEPNTDLEVDPSWIRRIRFTDASTSIDYLVIEGGGHGKLSDCEADFETQLVEVARKYVDQVVGKADAWKQLEISVERLRPYLVSDHEYIKTRENEFGITYLKYGQFAFNEDFRNWIRGEHRQAQQQRRVQVWMIGAGGLIGLLAMATVVLKTRGRCCR